MGGGGGQISSSKLKFPLALKRETSRFPVLQENLAGRAAVVFRGDFPTEVVPRVDAAAAEQLEHTCGEQRLPARRREAAGST